MPNPFTQINTAAQGTVEDFTGIHWVERYDGQEPADIASLVARRNSGCYVRVASGIRDPGSGGVQSDALLHFIIGAASLRGRAKAGEAAEGLLWTFLDNLEENRLNLSWLMMGLQYREFDIVHQTPNAVVMSLVMMTRFDMALWTE